MVDGEDDAKPPGDTPGGESKRQKNPHLDAPSDEGPPQFVKPPEDTVVTEGWKNCTFLTLFFRDYR